MNQYNYHNLILTDALTVVVRVSYEPPELETWSQPATNGEMIVEDWQVKIGSIGAFTHCYLETRLPREDVPTFLHRLIMEQLERDKPEY